MDRSRRTSATARRRTPGGSTSPVPLLLPDAGAVSPGITPPVSLSMSASAARSPPNTAQNTTQNTSQNTAQGIQTRRGSKSLHSSFIISTPASANRGQGIKRRCRTMDGCGLPNDSFEQNSPRKGGHTLRKTPRVDYTFEHVDDQVVVPNSTSSRAKRRKLDHAFESEDPYASGVKTRGASLGSDTAAGLRRSSASEAMAMALGPEPRDDEDVKDTIEVGVSYSDMEDSGVRRGSNASSSSADHPYNGSWISAPAASHLPQLYSDPDTFTADAARVLDSSCQQNRWEDSQEENIDPQLRASPPASLQPTTVDIAELAEVALPANAETHTGQTVDHTRIDSSLPGEQTADAQLATVATTGPHADASTVPTAKPAVSPGVSADGIATDVTNGILLPRSLAIEGKGEVQEEGVEVGEDSRVRESSISASEEIQRQLNATEAAADDSEPSNTTKTDAPGVSPDVGESFPSTSDAAPDEMDTPRTTQSSSLHVPTEDSAENVAEDAAKVTDLAAGAADSDEMADTKDSAARSEQPATIPFISVDQVDQSVEADAAGSPKEEENQEDTKETPNEDDEQGPVIEKTEISPTNSLAQNGKSQMLEETNTIAHEYGDDLETSRPSQPGLRKPQPTPEGRWSYLTPYLDGEFVTYPEKMARFDDDAGVDETAPEDKDGNEVESMVEDNDDVVDPVGIDTQTSALNTPLRGSPVQDLVDPALENSPAQAGDDADDGDLIDTQEAPEQRRYYRYRKLRDVDEFVTAIENYEDMSTEELVGALHAVAISLDQWKKEWKYLGTVVDDHENAVRRRAADAKYEARTKNIKLPGVNHEEPDFAVKGYKAKEREIMSETRYLQSQDRIMSATYGFEYDPHPSKIGRQNPETQQAGIMTRGRSLRNQPKQTVKASEADEVTGKRQRRPVQLFDPASHDSISRNSTPVPTRGRRRKQPNNGEAQVQFASSFNGGEQSDAEGSAPKAKRRRGPRASNAALEDDVTPRSSGATENEETGRSGRRRTARQAVRYDDAYSEFVDNDAQPETKQGHHHSKPHHHRKRHMLTLKIPRSKTTNEPSSAIIDNGESRPSSSSSDTTAGTAESSYSFRPNRQKRFRDSPDEAEEMAQAPARKRGKRAVPNSSQEGAGGAESSFAVDQHMLDTAPLARKFQKIKVLRPAQDIRHETPFSAAGADGDDKPKDYKSMTKSEKMSASMKSRWANGNMAGAVEKRKATLAAKKAAQVAADAKDGGGGGGGGTPAPKSNKPKHSKKEAQAAERHPAGGYVPAIPGMGYSFSAN